jgi:hypothetical protein
MLKAKIVSTYFAAYTMWLVSFFLWLWTMFIGRSLLMGMLATTVSPGATQQGRMVQLIDRFYLLFMGLAWLVLMIVVENYFRRGAQKGEVWRRIGKVIGPQLLLAFAVDLGLALFTGAASQPVTRWLILLLEFGLGVGLVILGMKAPRASRTGLPT